MRALICRNCRLELASNFPGARAGGERRGGVKRTPFFFTIFPVPFRRVEVISRKNSNRSLPMITGGFLGFSPGRNRSEFSRLMETDRGRTRELWLSEGPPEAPPRRVLFRNPEVKLLLHREGIYDISGRFSLNRSKLWFDIRSLCAEGKMTWTPILPTLTVMPDIFPTALD